MCLFYPLWIKFQLTHRMRSLTVYLPSPKLSPVCYSIISRILPKIVETPNSWFFHGSNDFYFHLFAHYKECSEPAKASLIKKKVEHIIHLESGEISDKNSKNSAGLYISARGWWKKLKWENSVVDFM